MTELDHASLNRILPAASGPADWDDVLSRSRPEQRRRRALPVVLTALALVALGTASAFAMRAAFGTERVGFIGLPPEGATPSTPKRGKLIISYFGTVPAKIIWTDRQVGKSHAWIYADGRLIWLRADDRPFGANHISTGYLEQRLTPEGVEQFRSAIIEAALPRRRAGRGGVLGYDTVRVREGGRLLGFGAKSARDRRKLVALFEDPATWLPASAWKERRIKAYVPSRFAVSYGGGPKAMTAARVFSLLPEPVANLLRAQERARRWGFYVSEVTTREARVLAKALADAELERVSPAWNLGYVVDVPGEAKEIVFISLEPVLPHGEWTCSPCG